MRILSIQSHVAYGYVGGKAAVFPLQCLGYDVDVVNTVSFSNHSGYGRTSGTISSPTDLESVLEGMERNELLHPTRLLTGYTPNAAALTAVSKVAQKLRQRTPDLVYLLDPVLGDAGRLYVSADVVPVYRSMLPLADIISPNWFEVETLTDIPLNDLASLRQALTVLHRDYKVPNVVVSSIPLQSWLLDALPPHVRPQDPDSPHLLCIASTPDAVYATCVPLIPGYFSGVGDLFSALLLGHYDPSDATPLATATSQALTKTHAMLLLTHQHAQSLPPEQRFESDSEKDDAEPLRKTRRMRGRELRLIQGQGIIRGQEIGPLRRIEHWSTFWQ